MNIRQALSWSRLILKRKSSSPDLDGEVLLSFILKKPKEFLYVSPDLPLSHIQYSKFHILINKRARHWPVAYLTSRKEFFGLDFKVTPDVLIPRPETELLVELALDRIHNLDFRIRNIIDVGTGSGNIIISVVKSLPPLLTRGGAGRGLNFFALDSSNKALKIAKLNARRHGVFSEIKFLPGHLLSPYLQHTTYNLPTLILANLPYLTPKQYTSNPDLQHEPRSALVGGKDGLKYFRNLFKQILEIRDSRLEILLEHDPSQKSALTKLAKQYFPSAQIAFHKDLAKRYRVAQIDL